MNVLLQIEATVYRHKSGCKLHVFEAKDTTPPYRRPLCHGVAMYNGGQLVVLQVVCEDIKTECLIKFANGKVYEVVRAPVVHDPTLPRVWTVCEEGGMKDLLGPIIRHFSKLTQPPPEVPEAIVRPLYAAGLLSQATAHPHALASARI